MEEGEYRDTYHEFNQLRCIFEKSILSRQTMCEHAHRFCLADREGVACNNNQANSQCEILLSHLRSKALFALKLTKIDGPLPHAKEVKVQTGGMLGLSTIVTDGNSPKEIVENIFSLIEQAKHKFGNLDALPYDEIARQIAQYQGRKRAKR
ncbi:hypothetical protein MNBD_GAMMA21-2859 [hydrothermal vent metagenome]|uniref:Uncharacterized protein n=1 Tax=hydrothermal vent metagenome TaxID=652676 RepID=A0A3B1AYF9_9ZZZZ